VSGADLDIRTATRLGTLDLDVALRVPAGRCLVLAGPSGAGKTSVLRTVAGLLAPREGTVRCGAETWLDTRRGISLPPERRRCGYLFQRYALFPHLRGWQNVAYPLRDGSRSERRRRALELLERFGVAHLADVRPGTSSGGESQRVALARSLARDPLVLLLDEPLSALDARTRAAAGREVKRIAAESGVPTLVVTHAFEEAALLGDEIAVVDGGRVLQRGTASDLAAAPANGFVADFTGAVVLTGVAAPGPSGLTAVRIADGITILSTEEASGAVAASVYPWEIELAAPGGAAGGSARNRLAARVVSVAAIGNRVRVTVDVGQPLAVEVTAASARALDLVPGTPVVAVWKASATRLTPT